MLKESARDFVNLGIEIGDARLTYLCDDFFEKAPNGDRRLNARGRDQLIGDMRSLLGLARKLDLPASTSLLLPRARADGPLPETMETFDLIVETLLGEMGSKLFLFVPSYRSSYYESHNLTLAAASEFRSAAGELRLAGNCYAFGEATAAIFHAMRAAEICVRVLATALGVTFSAPIETMEWQPILNAITPKITAIENQPKSDQRQADLEFFGTAAAQLRFFKDGWRVRVAHASELYGESQARDAIDHVRALIEILAERLSENP